CVVMAQPPSRPEARRRFGSQSASELGAPVASSIPEQLRGREPASARKGYEDALVLRNRRVEGSSGRDGVARGVLLFGCGCLWRDLETQERSHGDGASAYNLGNFCARWRRRSRSGGGRGRSQRETFSMSCIQEQLTEGVRPNARENDQIRPST